MREVLEGYEGGISISGRLISNLDMLINDIILLEVKLQELLNRLNKAGQQYNLNIKIEKMKVMNKDGVECHVSILDTRLEQVTIFLCL